MANLRTFCYRIICGFFLGFSTVAPGFSGSVVAIAMGIYRDLVNFVSHPFVDIKKNIRFLVPLAIGALLSLILFVLSFRVLFESHARATMLLFVGLIAGNLHVIGKEVKRHEWKARNLSGALLSFVVALGISLLVIGTGHLTGGSGAVRFWELIVGGFMAGAVAFIPGMSISAILIVTGIYWELIMMMESLVRLQVTYVPHVVGIVFSAILGLVLTARGIKKIFDRVPGFANACVLGFMSGTLVGIFIESLYLEDPSFSWWLGGLMLLAGVGLSSVFVTLGKKMGAGAEE